MRIQIMKFEIVTNPTGIQAKGSCEYKRLFKIMDMTILDLKAKEIPESIANSQNIEELTYSYLFNFLYGSSYFSPEQPLSM